jgi:hypothetical protein
MNFETKNVNVNDKEDVQIPQILVALRDKFLCLGMIIQILELPCFPIVIALIQGHTSYPMFKGTLIRS